MNEVQKCENCKCGFICDGRFVGRMICRLNPPIEHILTENRTVFPETTANSWCSHWQPKGDSHALVYADWLEERGQKEAADMLRGFDKQ